jgi:hypothetical protein
MILTNFIVLDLPWKTDIPQMIKEFPALKWSKGSSTCLQKSTMESYSESVQSSTYLHTKTRFNIILHNLVL